MKRLLLLFLVVCTLFAASCGTKNLNEEQSTNNEEVTADNTESSASENLPFDFTDGFEYSDAPLEELLTVSYDIDELDSFFINNLFFGTVIPGKESGFSLVTIDIVNESFPVEVLRKEEYTVYKVNQGGYYYVFWGAATLNSRRGFTRLVFSVLYIPSNNKAKDITNMITIGDRFEKLREIDKYAQLFIPMSHGQYAYSFVDKDTVIEFRLTDEHDYYLINSVKKISREDSASCFKSIIESDFPNAK